MITAQPETIQTNNIGNISQAVDLVQGLGRGPDTRLMHVTPSELQALNGLSGLIYNEPLPTNPVTGLPEASWFRKMLPMIGAIAGSFILPGLGTALGHGALATGLGAAGGSFLGNLGAGHDFKTSLGNAALAGLSAGAGKYFMGSGGLWGTGHANPFTGGGVQAAQAISPNLETSLVTGAEPVGGAGGGEGWDWFGGGAGGGAGGAPAPQAAVTVPPPAHVDGPYKLAEMSLDPAARLVEKSTTDPAWDVYSYVHRNKFLPNTDPNINLMTPNTNPYVKPVHYTQQVRPKASVVSSSPAGAGTRVVPDSIPRARVVTGEAEKDGLLSQIGNWWDDRSLLEKAGIGLGGASIASSLFEEDPPDARQIAPREPFIPKPLVFDRERKIENLTPEELQELVTTGKPRNFFTPGTFSPLQTAKDGGLLKLQKGGDIEESLISITGGEGASILPLLASYVEKEEEGEEEGMIQGYPTPAPIYGQEGPTFGGVQAFQSGSYSGAAYGRGYPGFEPNILTDEQDEGAFPSGLTGPPAGVIAVEPPGQVGQSANTDLGVITADPTPPGGVLGALATLGTTIAGLGLPASLGVSALAALGDKATGLTFANLSKADPALLAQHDRGYEPIATLGKTPVEPSKTGRAFVDKTFGTIIPDTNEPTAVLDNTLASMAMLGMDMADEPEDPDPVASGFGYGNVGAVPSGFSPAGPVGGSLTGPSQSDDTGPSSPTTGGPAFGDIGGHLPGPPSSGEASPTHGELSSSVDPSFSDVVTAAIAAGSGPSGVGGGFGTGSGPGAGFGDAGFGGIGGEDGDDGDAYQEGGSLGQRGLMALTSHMLQGNVPQGMHIVGGNQELEKFIAEYNRKKNSQSFQGGSLEQRALGSSPYFEGRVRGPGDGMSDNLPFMIAERQEGGHLQTQPAVLSPDEYVMPADVVSMLGNGSSTAGANQLDQFINNFRMDKYGRAKQPPEIRGGLGSLA